MSRTTKTRATYDDLCRVPEHKVAEIVDGELYDEPAPSAASLAVRVGPRR